MITIGQEYRSLIDKVYLHVLVIILRSTRLQEKLSKRRNMMATN